jgi:hypothetical protein
MKFTIRLAGTAAACVAAMASVGCQTYQLGQALPTPNILRDDLQYFQKGPSFPHHNELNAQIAAEREQGNLTR